MTETDSSPVPLHSLPIATPDRKRIRAVPETARGKGKGRFVDRKVCVQLRKISSDGEGNQTCKCMVSAPTPFHSEPSLRRGMKGGKFNSVGEGG
eukprot:3817121-Rhodomonas_salina.1